MCLQVQEIHYGSRVYDLLRYDQSIVFRTQFQQTTLLKKKIRPVSNCHGFEVLLCCVLNGQVGDFIYQKRCYKLMYLFAEISKKGLLAPVPQPTTATCKLC